jgi:hypothetical protein
LHVRAENARPDTAKKVAEFLAGTGMKRVSNQPYSRGLTTCDFSLFRYIKGRLAGASFEEPDQPLQAIDAIFQSLEKAPLEYVFQEWIDRRAQCCVAVGGLVEGMQKRLRMTHVLLDQFREGNSAPGHPVLFSYSDI